MKRTPLMRTAPVPARSKSRTAKAKRSAETEMKLLVHGRAFVHNYGRCEVCSLRPGTEVAHRLARSRMGEHRASNALLACRSCHQAQRDGRGGEGLAVALGQVLPSLIDGVKPDPTQIPVQTVYGRVLLDDEGGWVSVGEDW